MKALIIENEWEVDYSIQAFLKDNPKLFKSVQEELFCIKRPTEQFLPFILNNDAIIVASTWMYKDQLLEFVDGMLNPKFPPKKIFAHWILNTLNRWKHGNMDERELFLKVKQLLEKGFELFDFDEGDRKKKIVDNLNWCKENISRSLYQHWKVEYSEKDDLFYTKHWTLKYVKDDETRNR